MRKPYTNYAVQNGMKRNLFQILLIAAMFLLIACGGANSRADLQTIDELQELVQNGKYEIENEWASPMGGGNINLIGNPNSIRVKGDSVDIFLPYFGVRRMGGAYGKEGGIKYEGTVEDYTISESPQHKNVLVTFEFSEATETFNFSIRLYPGGSTQTSVNSTQRDVINYRGDVKPLKDEFE